MEVRTRIGRPLAGLALAALLTAVAAPSLRAAPARLQPASPQPPAAEKKQSPPTFEATTQLVQVDVIVRDGKGRFIDNLTQDDFKVDEDGKPQKIQTFALVGAPPGVVGRAAGTERGAPELLSVGRPIFIFVFDIEHMLPESLKRTQMAAEAFVRREFTGEPVGGVVANGQIFGNHLTSDPAELEQDIRNLKPRGSLLALNNYDLPDWPKLLSVEEAAQINAGNQAVLNEAVRRARASMPQGEGGSSMHPPVDIDPTPDVIAKAQTITAEVWPWTARLMTTLQVLMAGLEKFDGPKTVIFLSDGFYSDESWPEIYRIEGLAARARVRIYSIDSRGLGLYGDNASQMTPDLPSDALTKLLKAADSGSDGPNSLAVDTGGYAIRFTNQFGKALDEIASDTSTYYLLGYRPANTNFDGRFRTIDVKVDRGGVHVRARRGYLAVPSGH
ncbi:MAG TPA: VWA domain-containing protein [Vicinamibacterales bacterium]|nr:VWA domain-containing protein [Vicinamibacterales bacterium]